MKQDLQPTINALHTVPVQKQESGVTLTGYNKLKFSEHVWNHTPVIYSETAVQGKPVKEWEYASDDLISMVYVVVKVDEMESYFVKNKYRQSWESFGSKPTLFEKLFNDYQKYQYQSISDPSKIYTMNLNKIELLVYGKVGRVIDEEVVKIHAGTIPSVYRVVNYPMQEEFLCTDKGQFVLNIGSAYETITSEPAYEKASKFLRMIYRNLCNYPALEVNGVELTDEEEEFELYRKVMLNDYTEDDKDFKFVVHWCAALVQRPGINLMTNMWFAGEYQGIGKGTLVNFMKYILGEDRVGRCKPNIITGSFNAELHGKFILEINEKQQGISPAEMTNWLKGFSQEAYLQIEKKGQDPFTTINMINVIGTAQTPEDVFKIEDEDRRNVIFRTIAAEKDPALKWRAYAKVVATGLEHGEGWGEAVAFVLERVVIDWVLLNTAYQTRGYAEVKSIQLEAANPLFYWAQDKFTEYEKTGSKMLATDLFEAFKVDRPTSTLRSQSTFNKKLKELVGADGIAGFQLTTPQNRLTANFGWVR